MSDEKNFNKIKKIRTFREDVLRARSNSSAETKKTTPQPDVTQPSVLSTKDTATKGPIPTLEQTKIITPKAIDKKVPTKVTSELAKQTEDLLSSRSGRSVAGDFSVLDQENEIGEGSIITDRKKDRFKFFPALVESIKFWFVEEKEAIEARAKLKRDTVPKVRTLDKREAVVKKAGQQSILAPKDDYKELKNRLPEEIVDKKSEPVPIINIKDKDEVPTLNWQHFEDPSNKKSEPSEEAVEEPVQKIPTEESRPTTSPVFEATTIAQETKKEPTNLKETINKEVPTPTPQLNDDTPKETDKNIPPSLNTQVKVLGQKKAKPSKSFLIPRYIYMYTLIVLISVGAASLGVMSTWWLFGKITSTPTAENNIETTNTFLVRMQQEKTISLPNNKSLLFKEVKSITDAGITVLNIRNQTSRATVAEILNVLSWRVDGAFLRNISDINLGAEGNQPFIILKVQNFDTAFGGILATENNLTEDLSELFNIEAVGEFKDDVVKNTDVRILSNQLSEEVVVYGFVNRSTIIITTDSDTFASISEVIQ